MTYDPEPCKLRNSNGSECGTCNCQGPMDCPAPPRVTAMGLRMMAAADQFLAKVEDKRHWANGGIVEKKEQ